MVNYLIEIEGRFTAEPGQSLSRNKVTDRAATKQSIGGLTTHFGLVYTAHAPDRPKTLGSQQATHAAASLGIDDLITTPSREWLIRDAEPRGRFEEQHYCYGNVHAVERSRRLIEARYTTSEYAKAEMNPNFRMTDPSNPVHVMPLPGARGNISQTHQLLGTRGSTPDPKGQTIDLPIRSNPREGLSPTEHMIPRHGARKGIADIAVRTADAGYPTRRLVEVVQRVVVRTVDRGTVRGIFVNPVRDRQGGGRMIAQSRLIGRVSTDNAYADTRCIAVRNQDTGADPADQSIAFQKKPISIRSPLVRRSTFWIRRLRHGWSLTHGDSVEPGEAVGIIAGQSIGEPGTQLTLRTFHTGGTFTGGAAQRVRTPFTGTITSDANSVHPTRTRHGHPAWICDDDLSVVTRNEYEARDPTIPSQSLIPVRNNQHVEAKQVIAGVRATAPVPRERVHKYIHSNLYGEMHLGTKVLRRSPAGYSRHSNTHILPETCYVRVLSGSKVPRAGGARYIFYGGGDRIGARPLLAGRNQSPPDPYTGGYTNTDHPCHLHPGEPNEPPTSNRTCSHVLRRGENFIIPLPLPYSYKVATHGHEKKGGGVSCSFGWHGRCGKEKVPRSVPEMQQNEILRVADDGSLNDRSGYAATAKPETIESRVIRVGSVRKKIDIGHDGARRLVTRYHGIVVGREGHFRLISENIRCIVHGFPTHSALRANGARVGTRMAASFSDVYGRRLTGESAGTQDVCGEGSVMGILLRRNAVCTKEPSGGTASQSAGASVPPARAPGAFNEAMNWNHRRRVVSYTTDKAFASSWRGEREGRGRFTTEKHETRGESSGVFKLPSWNSLGEGGRGAKGGTAIQYPHGVNGVGYTGVQPAQPHRLLSDQRKHNLTVEDAPPIEVVTDAPFTKCCASTNRGSIGYTSIRGGSYDMGTGPKYISGDGICRRVGRYPNGNNLVSGQHEGIPRIPPGSQERTSFSIFSFQDNACRIPPSTTHVSGGGGRPAGSSNRGSDMTIPFIANPLLRGTASSMTYPRHDERGTRLDPIMITDAFLVPPPGDPAQAAPLETPGLPGNTHGTGYSSPCRRLTRRCLACDIFSVDSTTSNPLKDTSEVLDKWFLRNEDRAYSQLIMRKQTRSSDCLCPSSPTRCLPSSPSCTAAPRSASIGRLICGGVSVYKSSGLPHQSCQAEAFGAESAAVTRSAEPYLASKGAAVRGGFGSVAGEGDALVTLVRERLRFEDITFQGPPKIERFLEPRPNTLVSTDPKGSFKSWSSGMAWIFGRALGRLPSARISLERGRVNSVDCIGRGYRSQGVQVADKHVEMIARQVTSKMVALEDGMANASPPGELIEASRARRMDCALGANITFGPVLLGITRASLNTESFTPEASSRETTRALAGAAIRGQMDWSKGLKESIIVGGTIPAGTGYEGALCRVVSLGESGEISETEGNPFHAENLFLNGTKLRPLPGEGTARDASASICYVEKRL